jgi:hypothetical protein
LRVSAQITEMSHSFTFVFISRWFTLLCIYFAANSGLHLNVESTLWSVQSYEFFQVLTVCAFICDFISSIHSFYQRLKSSYLNDKIVLYMQYNYFLEIYFLFIIIVQLSSKYCRFKIELAMLSITFIPFNIWHENRLFEIILIHISCKRKVSKNHLFFGQVVTLSELNILMNLKLMNQSLNRLSLNYCFKN